MTTPTRITQGASKTIHVQSNIDVSAATEIELRVDTESQISKTLSAGQITNVSTSGFDVEFEPADTKDKEAKDYLYQVRATMPSGKILQGKFTPNKFSILPSIFETVGSIKDYN